MRDEELVAVVRAACDGNQRAWDVLVERYSGLVWAVARAHRLGAAEAADVSQATWLRLVEHLRRIREPSRLGAWLATTAARESLRVIRRSGRHVPVDDLQLAPEDDSPPADAALLAGERDRALWQAVDNLPDRCRMLLRVLMADPPPSYVEAAAVLDMPVGSIGPTRARCLERLRSELKTAGITVGASGLSFEEDL